MLVIVKNLKNDKSQNRDYFPILLVESFYFGIKCQSDHMKHGCLVEHDFSYLPNLSFYLSCDLYSNFIQHLVHNVLRFFFIA